MTAALAALWHPFPIFLAASLVCAVGYCALVDQARRRDARTKAAAHSLQAAIDAAKAENERRRAIHPSGRDVSKRPVHIAADWRDMWADFYRTEHVS